MQSPDLALDLFFSPPNQSFSDAELSLVGHLYKGGWSWYTTKASCPAQRRIPPFTLQCAGNKGKRMETRVAKSPSFCLGGLHMCKPFSPHCVLHHFSTEVCFPVTFCWHARHRKLMQQSGNREQVICILLFGSKQLINNVASRLSPLSSAALLYPVLPHVKHFINTWLGLSALAAKIQIKQLGLCIAGRPALLYNS